ncbi:MAG: ABC transporter permease [Kineosporiaceae bacterium]
MPVGLLAAVVRAVVLLAAASLVIFMAAAALPGDAVEIRSGGRVDPAQLADLRAEAGLDRPLPQRYLDWVGGLGRGDLGESLVTGRPVADVVAERLPVSGVLLLASLVLAVPLAAGAAWLAAEGPGVLRPVVTAATAATAAVPQVVVAVLLTVLLAGVLGLVPTVSLLPVGTSPWARPDLLVLPVLTLALPSAAFAAGLLRGAWEDVTARPFVRDAVVRGVPAATVALRYVLPGVAPTALRVLAVVTGGLVAGTALAEVIFGMAGLGELLVSAVGARDAPVVQAVALLGAAVVVAGMLAADLLAAAVSPGAVPGPRRAAGERTVGDPR